MSSRDLGTLYRTELDGLKVVEEIDPPGVAWAGLATNDGWRFTIGKGLNDESPCLSLHGLGRLREIVYS